jgi:hypothetical protein
MPTTTAQATRELITLLRGRHPLIAIRTAEDDHAARMVREAAIDRSLRVVGWTAVRGLHEALTEDGDAAPGTEHAAAALQHLATGWGGADRDGIVAIMQDLGPHLSDPRTARALRELVHRWHGSDRHIVMIDCEGELPASIAALTTRVEIPLPDEVEIDRIVRATVRELSKRARVDALVTDTDLRMIVRNLAGLTRRQVEQIVVDATLDDGRFGASDLPLILERKRRMLTAAGVLEFVAAPASLDEVGGLRHLKAWVAQRGRAFDEKAAGFGIRAPRGVLILGVQGTGKSLSAKAIATAWKRPLARLDPGALYDKFVGESERRLRDALRQAEAMAPVVMWIDEIEKGFAGAATQSVDGGLSKRMFGALLTWMQEHRSHVFLVATANDIEALPPELLRKGRFDEIFFVDLPDESVRREVFAIHFRRCGRDPAALGIDLDRLAAATEGYSPAEIDHAVNAALHDAYETGGAMTTDLIERAALRSPPLSATARERVEGLREWARGRCVWADGTPEDSA